MASQAHGVRDRTGVTADEAAAAAWTVSAGGIKVGGARAIALALSTGRAARWPAWPWNVPGAPWLLDGVYAVVARHRHRLPGETPWCVRRPDECTTRPPSSD